MNTVDAIIKFSGRVAALSLILLVLLVAYDALARYWFSSGSIALQELEWHLFDLLIMLAIAYTLKLDSHVRVDIFYEHFSQRRKALIDTFAQLIFVIPFSFLIIYVGSEFVLLSFSQMEASSNPGGLPYRFIVKSLMPLAFVLLLFQSIKEVITAVSLLRGTK